MTTATVKLHSKIAKFKASIEKRTSIKDVFLEPTKRLDYVNSGSTVLNMLMGGSKLPDGSFVCPGYPKGRIVEIYGRESSGKSTLALSALAHAIDNGGRGNGCGLYVDLECAVVDKYAKKIGVDFTAGAAIRAMPHSFEETESLVMGAALNGIDLIVVDSVAGLVSGREAARDTSDKKQKQGVAEVPRLMSNWMPKLQGVIARTGTTVIFLNQTRDKIGAMGYTEEALKSTTGGNALKFWASIRMLLKPKVSTKAKRFNPLTKSDEEVQIATDIEIKMIKNKVDAKQGHTGLITIRYGVGVDELRTMLNVAEAYKIARVVKNKLKQEVWTFKGPQSGKVIECVGVERFRLEIQREPELLQEMLGFCQQKLIEGYDMISDEELAALAEGAVQKKDGDDDDDYEATDAPNVQFDEQTDVDDPEMQDPVEAAAGVDMSDISRRTMSDTWENERGDYDVPLYSSVARAQKERLILRVSSMDPLFEGVELESGDPDFHKFVPLAEEAFGPGPFARISLRADPWKASGSWKISADRSERNIGMSLVRKHLGGGDPA